MSVNEREPKTSEVDDSGSVNVQKKILFSDILDKVKKVDFFNEIQKIETIEKPKLKHYQIVTINKLLKLGIGFRYTNQNIYIYNGTYWEVVNEDDFKSLIGDVSLKMGINKFDSVYYRYRIELVNQFMSMAYKDEPDSNKDIVNINLANGTLEIDNGK